MTPSASQRLDRVLWYAISIVLAILVFVSFVRITSFEAFVELKSSALRFEFVKEGPEAKIVEFGSGTTITDARDSPKLMGLVGAYLAGISALSAHAGLRLESLGAKQDSARVCLLQGRYFVNAPGRQELLVRVDSDDNQECVEVAIKKDFLVFPRKVVVEPRVDSRGMEIHPDMSGKLRIQKTDKELLFISGMTLHLLLNEKPATSVAFADGQFGIHAWKEVEVLWSDRDEPIRYYFTPLDRLRKYAEDNGLWYSISLLIGIVFGIRKLLLLR